MADTSVLQIMKAREGYYRFLSRLYEKEVSASLLRQLAGMNYETETENKDIKAGYEELKRFFTLCNLDGMEDELAADFARVFLGAGEAKGDAAYPYESVYTSKKRLVMQEAWEQVTGIYAERSLVLHAELSDIKEDHISMELKFMAYLCALYGTEDTKALLKEQKEFLAGHLLNWVEAFTNDIETYASTGLYKALAKLTKGFLAEDMAMIEELLSENDESEIGSFQISEEEMDEFLLSLQKSYRIYAPKALKGRGAKGQDLIRYKEIKKASEIVWDRPSDFSAKEVYYPTTQTMLYFTDTEVIESSVKDDKGILLFLRPCDINAMRRIDNVFLKNGIGEDHYYKRLREKVKIVMMECSESYENCFCVSMGSNLTEDYSLAVRFEQVGMKIQVKDESFAAYFKNAEAIKFTPSFVTENKRRVTPPVIEDQKVLKLASSLDYWSKYDDKCIGCGGCNTVCPTCSCFDTIDITYTETSKEGERRRVWSSCMLDTFTMTAGGARARKTAGANMRFKTLHKMYDYQKRFREGENMCVGCGRCVNRCSKQIDFIDTVNGFHDALEAAKEGGQA